MKIVPLLSLILAAGLAASFAPAATTNAPSATPPAVPTGMSVPPKPMILGSNLPPGANLPPDPHRITQAEWQHLNSVRQSVLQSNHQLQAESMEMAQRMRAFQDKLTAAMIQTDPNIAPVIAKFQAMSAPRPSTTPASGSMPPGVTPRPGTRPPITGNQPSAAPANP